MEPSVSIIIVNWNAGKYIIDCIKSLKEQTYHNFEIILVDNASTDNSLDLVTKNFSEVKIIKNNENLGFAKGNNTGIQIAQGDMIALFNPDAIADKNWLKILVSVLQSSSTIGAVSGKIFYLGDKFGKNTVFCTWPKIGPFSASPNNFHDNEETARVDYLSGAAMLIKKEVIKKIGLLDTDYFLYFEETDLCARMIRAGYELVYVPDAVVWHSVSSTLSNSEDKLYYMERNRIRFAIKNFDLLYLIIFYFVSFAEFLFIIVRDIVHKNFFRSKVRWKAILWNLRFLKKTLSTRKENFSHIKKTEVFKSYNNSLPLRRIKPNKK